MLRDFVSRLRLKNRYDASVTFGRGVKLSGDVTIGKHCFINDFTRITQAEIGSYVSIGNNVAIGQGEHPSMCPSTHIGFERDPFALLTAAPCSVGSDVWIGSYAFIKRGVRVHDGAIIGTHSVVTRDVPPFAIVAGVPARVLRYRCDEDTRDKMLEIKWWTWEDSKINKYRHLFTGNTIEKFVLNDFD